MTFIPQNGTQPQVPIMPHLPQLPLPTTGDLSGRRYNSGRQLPQLPNVAPYQKPQVLQPPLIPIQTPVAQDNGWSVKNVLLTLVGGIGSVAAIIGAIFLAIMFSKKDEKNGTGLGDFLTKKTDDADLANALGKLEKNGFKRHQKETAETIKEDAKVAQILQKAERTAKQISDDEQLAFSLAAQNARENQINDDEKLAFTLIR